MSYSRWSTSHWYSFYNVNGCLSLWYDMDHTIDLDIDLCKEATTDGLMSVYGCTLEEAEEAMKYIEYFIEDYDPKVSEEYEKEIARFYNMLNKMKDEGK